MTNEEMLKVLEDLKYQFDDRIEEAKYSKDEDLLEALESNKMTSEALDMAIQISSKTLERPNVRLTNSEWIDFLCEQFDVSRTSAKEMLHTMMSVKKEDNFKKQFSGKK